MDSLHALADAVRQGHKFEVCLGDFLDAFYFSPASDRINQAPEALAGTTENGAVHDAFLAATGEYLARHHGLPIPSWVFEQGRYRQEPYFPLKSFSIRVTLLLESPMEFRSRNLFVTTNALARASQHATRNVA